MKINHRGIRVDLYSGNFLKKWVKYRIHIMLPKKTLTHDKNIRSGDDGRKREREGERQRGRER